MTINFERNQAVNKGVINENVNFNLKIFMWMKNVVIWF